VPRRRDANRKAVIAAAGTILIGIVCVIAVFGVNTYAPSTLYDDFEKHELEKTFTQAIN
jgi:hypothetical protein